MGIVKTKDHENQHLQEKEIARTVKKYAKLPEKRNSMETSKKKWRRNKDAYRRNRKAKTTEEDKAIATPRQKQHIPDETWKLVDARTIISMAPLWIPKNEDMAKQQLRAEKRKTGGGKKKQTSLYKTTWNMQTTPHFS